MTQWYGVVSGWHILYNLGIQNLVSRFPSSFQVGKLWKTKIEPKVKVFGWTTMHQKILTADNLEARGKQHSLIWPLCNLALENAATSWSIALSQKGHAFDLGMVRHVRADLYLLQWRRPGLQALFQHEKGNYR
jgi:hypothetical protein